MYRFIVALLITALLASCGVPGVTVERTADPSPLSEAELSATVVARASLTSPALTDPGPARATVIATGSPPQKEAGEESSPVAVTVAEESTVTAPVNNQDNAEMVVAVSRGGIVSVLSQAGWSIPEAGVGRGCNKARAAFDSDGSVWVACVNSHTSTDGTVWQQPEAAYGDTGVYSDARGRLWSIGVNAIHLHEGGSWRTFTASDTIGQQFFPVGTAAFTPDGTAYFGGAAGPTALVSFDGARWKNYGKTIGILPFGGPEALFASQSGVLLAGAQGAVYRLDGDTFTPLVSNEQFAQLIGEQDFKEPISDLAETPDGTLWVATPVGLFAYQGTQLRRLGRADGLPSNQINDLTLDGDGRLWVATAHGIAMQSADGWQTAVPSSSGLGDSFLAALAVLGAPKLPPAEQEIKTATISGRVVENGSILPNTIVELCSESPRPSYFEAQSSVCPDQFYTVQTKTDGQGLFRFEEVPLGTYTLVAANAAGEWVVPIALDILALKAGQEYVQNLDIS